MARASGLGKWGAKRATAASRVARNGPCLRSNWGRVTTPNQAHFQIGYNGGTKQSPLLI